MASHDKEAADAAVTEHLLSESEGESEQIEMESPSFAKPRPRFQGPGLLSRLVPRRGVFSSFILGVLATLATVYVIATFHQKSSSTGSADKAVQAPLSDLFGFEASEDKIAPATKRPENIKIVGVIFYGRRQFVDILDCYLRRNLASNGGYLDEVHFLLHPNNDKETPWLQTLIKNSPELEDQYKIFHHEKDTFVQMWKHFIEPETLYIKIDDDIIYMHEDAITNLVETTIAHPEAHSMQSNIINNGWTHWLHWHTDAVHAYLPEQRPLKKKKQKPTWRASQLPRYKGNFPNPENMEISYRHRWLPVGDDSAKDVARTPIITSRPPLRHLDKGVERNPWEIGAQELYSLLQNIEANTTSLYWAGNNEGVWNLWYGHYSINLMAIWGKHISLDTIKMILGDDETALTETIPRLRNQPVKIATRSIVGHFANYKQRRALLGTDLLDRFRAYANENVCARGNQKVAFPVPPGCSNIDPFVC